MSGGKLVSPGDFKVVNGVRLQVFDFVNRGIADVSQSVLVVAGAGAVADHVVGNRSDRVPGQNDASCAAPESAQHWRCGGRGKGAPRVIRWRRSRGWSRRWCR